MLIILFLLSIFSLIAFIAGMINPSLVIRWGDDEDKTRKNVRKIFLTATIVFFVLFLATPTEEEAEIAEKEKIEKQQQKEEEKKTKEKEKKEKEEKNKFVFDQEFLDSPAGRANSKVAAEYFIEEYEKQKIRKLNLESIAIYSSDPVRDQSEKEYPYSSMLTGRYEEKGTGALRDFTMTLVYDNEEDAKNGNARCAQYLNDDTGTYINVMHEEDDVILKLLEIFENEGE